MDLCLSVFGECLIVEAAEHNERHSPSLSNTGTAPVGEPTKIGQTSLRDLVVVPSSPGSTTT